MSEAEALAVRHKLAPAAIPFERTVGWITAVCIAIPLLVVLFIAWYRADHPAWVYGFGTVLWLAITAGLVWLAVVWPVRAYQATSTC